MTAARQKRERALPLRRSIHRLTAGLALIAIAMLGWRDAGASPVHATVTDPQTGIALSGFDPVAYFIDAVAERGRPQLELTLKGVVWRFRNEGNRAAFADNPDVYAPRFGGYDPVAIARGASVPGHPIYWVVSGQRLYLFYSAAARAAFLADSRTIIAAAERKWPAIQAALP
jgi:hypothetical protein